MIMFYLREEGNFYLSVMFVQGMCQLLETNVVIRCRQKDVALVKVSRSHEVTSYYHKYRVVVRIYLCLEIFSFLFLSFYSIILTLA